VETPSKLNQKQKDLMQEFGELESDYNQPEKSSFLEKIKSFFG
jgi:DnaJ-class molecular chaperone